MNENVVFADHKCCQMTDNKKCQDTCREVGYIFLKYFINMPKILGDLHLGGGGGINLDGFLFLIFGTYQIPEQEQNSSVA